MSVVLAFCNNQIYKNKYFGITGNQFQDKIQILMSFAKGCQRFCILLQTSFEYFYTTVFTSSLSLYS